MKSDLSHSSVSKKGHRGVLCPGNAANLGRVTHPHTGHFPAAVTATVEAITRHTGRTPAVERLRHNKWQLALTDGRVEVTMRFKRFSVGGRTRSVFSSITVDGKKHGDYCCAECLADLLDKAAPGAAPAVPDPMPPAAPVEQAPVLVQQWFRTMHAVLTKHNAKHDTQLVAEIGSAEDGRWVAGIEFPRGSLRLYFRRTSIRRGATSWAWGLDREALQLIIDGFDRTKDTAGDLDKALELLMGSAPGTRPAAPGSIGRPSDAKAVNSVQVRRSTVIRV